MERSVLIDELKQMDERNRKFYTSKIKVLEEQVKNGVSAQESVVRQVRDLETENKLLKGKLATHTGCICKSGQETEREKEIARLREYSETLRGRDLEQIGVIEELRKSLFESERKCVEDTRRLQNELAQQTAQLNEATATMASAIEQSKHDCDKLSNECEAKVTRLEQTLLDIQRQVEEAQKLVGDKNDSAKIISCELEATRRELSNSKQECVTLSREKVLADDRATKLEQQVVNLTTDMASKAAELQVVQQNAQRLQDQLTETNLAMANMEGRLKRICDELEMSKTERTKASTKISELQEQLKLAAYKLICTDSKNEALLKELAETRSGKDSTIESLEKQLIQICKELEMSKNEETKARAKISELQELLEENMNKLVCTDSKNQALLKELAETRMKSVAVQGEMTDKFVLENNLLQTAMGEKCQRIGELEMQLGQIGDTSNQCLEELNLMTSERNRLGEKIRRMYAEKKATSLEQEDKRSREFQELRECCNKKLEEKDSLLLEKQAQLAKMLNDAVRKDVELLETRTEIATLKSGKIEKDSAVCVCYRQRIERMRREIDRLRTRIRCYENRKTFLKDALIGTDNNIKVKVVKRKPRRRTVCPQQTFFGPELITHFFKR